jgi:hypothetical protein
MNLFVRANDSALTPNLKTYIERRVRMVLGRFSPKIAWVTVRLSDVKEPAGGADKRCRIETRFWGRVMVVVEDAAVDFPHAIDRSIRRMGDGLARVA